MAGSVRMKELDHEVAEKGREHDDGVASWGQHAIGCMNLQSNRDQCLRDLRIRLHGQKIQQMRDCRKRVACIIRIYVQSRNLLDGFCDRPENRTAWA